MERHSLFSASGEGPSIELLRELIESHINGLRERGITADDLPQEDRRSLQRLNCSIGMFLSTSIDAQSQDLPRCIPAAKMCDGQAGVPGGMMGTISQRSESGTDGSVRSFGSESEFRRMTDNIATGAAERYAFIAEVEKRLRGEVPFEDFAASARELVIEAKAHYAEKLGSEDVICLISLAGECYSHLLAQVGCDLGPLYEHPPRGHSFCQHTLNRRIPIIIENTAKDERFVTHPLVAGEPHIRFYSAAPLIYRTRQESGGPLYVGALCLFDTQPRSDFKLKDASFLQTQAARFVECLKASMEEAGIAHEGSISSAGSGGPSSAS